MSVVKPIGVHALVRRTHEDRVLVALRERGALSRSELATVVGLSRTTLSEITGSLLARGAIIVVDTDATSRSGSGRPAERLALDPRSGQYLGVDFGHRRVQVAVADASHEIIASGSARYDDGIDWRARLDTTFALIEEVSSERGTHFGALQAVGIGVPGPYARTTTAEPGMSWGRREPAEGIDEAFHDRFGARVVVDNNTRFAALAEALSIGSSGGDDVIYLRLSDGVGGGLVIGGRLVVGSAGLAGELGHVAVAGGTRSCRCGKTGCLETVAATPEILAECRRRGVDVNDLDDLRREVARAHPVVDAVLRDIGGAVGRALGTAAMTLNPSSIVLGGPVVDVAPALVDAARSALRFELASISPALPDFRTSTLGDLAGAVGAIAAVFRESPLLANYPGVADAVTPSPTMRSSIR
ncbi:ROK family transcriptional regulator [Labedella endophytica]|uniref:ROK family transcriptional regulator n=1 Tax=Labedella endophytica TaxID=1523160 RepID=A0A433JUC8_9MICO|nr:ROK family transcriptional regulator [Labedella endophytica]RUR01800.1 ROK family transcriptional regulator [Labedella endophytica]